jgi:ubiquinone/menaquinone biosynthesis C-methylase UbiE
MAEGHRWFAAIYDRMTASDERTIMKNIRSHLVGGARGRVLEIGAGTGANFPYYREAQIQTVIATEPDPFMLERARRRLKELGLSIELRQASAEELPFEDSSFDTVISTWVMCSVRHLQPALSEIRRVLRPSGQLRFYEHVRFNNRLAALMQDIATPVWRWFGAGCHPNRDLGSAVERAGFRLADLQRLHPFPPIPPISVTQPHVLGVAYPR